MTGYAARAPRERTVYVCPVTVDKVTDMHFRVVSTPPIHAARVIRHGYNGLWRVEFHTLDVLRRYDLADLSDALKRAGDLVGRKAGADWSVMTGPQRYAIGQQECPKGMAGGVLCRQLPDVGSIWCGWHPKGKVRKDA